MQRNLLIKMAVIVATVLVCIFGIIGFPSSGAQLRANVARRIRLGLDLKGGSHLVLQVQVQDAAKTQADQVIESLREEARSRNIPYGGADRNDPATIKETDSIQVTVHAVDQAKTQHIYENYKRDQPQRSFHIPVHDHSPHQRYGYIRVLFPALALALSDKRGTC